MKKIGIILLPLCLLVCLGGCGTKKNTYREAQELLEGSSYVQAEELFSTLGDYEDAAKQSRECKYLLAKSLIDADEPDYVQAVRLLDEIGGYKDAIALKTELQDLYFFPEYGYRVPGMECVASDAQRTDERGNDENGAFHRYTYSWAVAGYDTAGEVSDLFVKWLDCIGSASGLETQPHRNGAFILYLDDDPFGILSTQKSDTTLSVSAVLYDEPI